MVISDIHRVLWVSAEPVDVRNEPQQGTRSQAVSSLRTEDGADFEIYGMKFSTSWLCVGNQKIEMFLTYDGHLGGFGGHFGHFLDHFGEPIQNKGVFCSKRKSPVLPCLGWGRALMTWQGKNIKFWKNLVPFKHMFTVKNCVFWPFFCILKPMIGGQKKEVETALILNLTLKSNSCLQKWVYEALKSLWTQKKIFLNFEFRFFFVFFPSKWAYLSSKNPPYEL